MNWIIDNKEWLFSGVGVTVFTLIVGFFWKRLANKNSDNTQYKSAGGVDISGSLEAGHGNEADGGNLEIVGGTGKGGASGGSIKIGPGTHRAGDGGSKGKGGNLTIKGGNAE